MPKRLKVNYSWEDGEKLLNACNHEDRIQIPIRLQIYSGLREGEIFGSAPYGKGTPYHVKDDPNPHYSKPSLKPLTPGDLDLEHSSIRLKGKGGTFVNQPIDAVTCSMLKAYLDRYKWIKPNTPIFQMSTRCYQNKVKMLAMRAGIQNAEYFSTHKLRAIFITHVGRLKGALVAQTLARHRSIAMTSIYMRPTDAEKQADYNEMFKQV